MLCKNRAPAKWGSHGEGPEDSPFTKTRRNVQEERHQHHKTFRSMVGVVITESGILSTGMAELCQAEASWQCVHIRSQVDAIIIMAGEVGLAANES